MTISTNRTVIIYTDGACSGNPGIGGWGAVLKCGENIKEIYGGSPDTTNNKMELIATIEALSVLKYSCSVELYTDSQYTKKGICEWIKTWEMNGWKNSRRQAVANRELWQRLSDLTKKHNVQWFWVKGHSDSAMNNLADQLARRWIEENHN
ncbi:MAG: ribonuclease HI [Rickettsiales bacterium]|jgi:ribonuclease HI|nr:ribonuclease HI [Rickettsiales bacterium]